MTCIGYGTQTCPLAIPCLGPCRYVETRQGWHPTHDPIQTPASHNRVCDLCGITDDEYIQAALPCLGETSDALDPTRRLPAHEEGQHPEGAINLERSGKLPP